jgi:hypothetical protein
VVRVADCATARPASRTLDDVRVEAASPGRWGNTIQINIMSTGNGLLTVRLRDAWGRIESWRNVAALAEINNDSALVRVQTAASAGVSTFPLARQRISNSTLDGGQDGLQGITLAHFQKGLARLEQVDEVSIVAIPDLMPKPVVERKTAPPPALDCRQLSVTASPATLPAAEFPPPLTPAEIDRMQQELLAHCIKLRDRVAILDVGMNVTDPQLAVQWREPFDSPYGALYYPWIAVPDPLRLTGLLRPVPPSGHLAGIYARGDLASGVHKPPANEELLGVKDVTVPTAEIAHGFLNERQVNVIRPVDGRGIRVLGARTLSRDTEWHYVNVRRLVTMIEEAIDEQLQWVVFEPNEPALWGDIERVIRNFLRRLWRQGMLDGATGEDAFYVKCDQATNPSQEIDQGRLFCEIGLNPPWPAEFVIVRIGIAEGGTEILEEGGRSNG